MYANKNTKVRMMKIEVNGLKREKIRVNLR